MKLYWSREVKEVDRIAIEEMGIPSLSLMENAARALTRALHEELPGGLLARPLILCGKGNNGGDGMAVARLLRGQGSVPTVVLLGEPDQLSPDARAQWERLDPAGVPCRILSSEASLGELGALLAQADLAVDALLGTGLGGPAKGLAARAIEALNDSGALVVSVDVPSGLSGDALAPLGPAVEADLTLTLALAKPVLLTPEGAPFCGRVRLLDIGLPPEAAARVTFAGEALDADWGASRLPTRREGAHKGDLGRLLIVAGGRGRSGAAVLAARGALRAGAGLVTVATPASSQPVVAASLPEAMTLPLPETSEGTLSMDALMPLLEACGGADAVGLGPGLGTGAETSALCAELYRRVAQPLALDADGLNAFAGDPAALARHAGERVLTPHPGEMGRLVGEPADHVLGSRYDLAPARAAQWNVTLLLKGYRTLVAVPGRPWRMNLSGGPHMAGPGFGDVLTGVVTALLARGMEPFDAASLAAWWHGAAADAAQARLGGFGLLASECADALPGVAGGAREP